MFEIQEQVSRAIVDSLRVKLSVAEDQRLVVATVNPIAYDAFLRARRDIWSFTREGLDRALRDLGNALEVVGEDVLLYRGLALANWQYVNAGISGDPVYIEKAEDYARRIIAIDPDSHHGTSLLGYIAVHKGDITTWVRQFEKAVAAEPRDPDYLLWLALGWLVAGHAERAQPYLDRLQSIDPLFDLLHFALGFVEYSAGNFAASLGYYKRGHQLTPKNPAWPLMICLANGSMGDLAATAAEVEALAEAPDQHPLARLTHIVKYALLGDAAAVDELATEELATAIWSDLQYTLIMAQAQALLNRADEAMNWLERAVVRGYIHYPYLSETDPLLADLRGDPRYVALMAKVKVQWEGFEAAVDMGSSPGAGPTDLLVSTARNATQSICRNGQTM